MKNNSDPVLFKYYFTSLELYVSICFIGIPLLIIWHSCSVLVSILFSVAILYIPGFYFFRSLKFFRNHFEVVFPLRFYPLFKQKKYIISYPEIKKIIFHCKGIGQPSTIIELKEYPEKRFKKSIYTMVTNPVTFSKLYAILKKENIDIDLITTDEIKKRILTHAEEINKKDSH
jgi:hypothetical protein